MTEARNKILHQMIVQQFEHPSGIPLRVRQYQTCSGHLAENVLLLVDYGPSLTALFPTQVEAFFGLRKRSQEAESENMSRI